ncbi:MAG: glutathione S-transferase C-terminal domain-containing protein, partial [Candidatus Margulisiibacteriota bacterium]
QDVNPDNETGEFKRMPTSIREQIATGAAFSPEPNRYHLIVSYACPWAHRTLIYRKIKGLEDYISLAVVNPYMGPEGWDFTLGEGVIEPSFGDFKRLGDVYLSHDPKFTGRVTVPVLWDSKTNAIVNNESSDIIRMFNSAFNDLTGNTIDLYPLNKVSVIDEWNDYIYGAINNGVYKVGFARSQAVYEKEVLQLFVVLDEIDVHLSKNEFLCGDQLTESDIRLFVTLLRFDHVYVGHFKCNLNRIKDYNYLPNYLDRVRYMYDIEDTIRMDHIKQHYYQSHPTINPSGIVPLGPVA